MSRDKLQSLKKELQALPESPDWSSIKSWIAKAKPVIRTFYKECLDDFVEVTREPQWLFLPRAFGRDRYTGRETSNSAQADAAEARENARLCSESKRAILSFLDGLLQVDSTALKEPVGEASGWQIMVSHAASDHKIVDAFLRCLEGGLEAPDKSIRCTSVPGHRLDPGDDAANTLRSNIEKSSVFIGLLTENSLKSGFVLMELGAAWAFRKRTCLVLAPSIDFNQIPGPFAGRLHAIRMTSLPDVMQLLDVVAKTTGFSLRNTAKLAAAAQAFVETAESLEGSIPRP